MGLRRHETVVDLDAELEELIAGVAARPPGPPVRVGAPVAARPPLLCGVCGVELWVPAYYWMDGADRWCEPCHESEGGRNGG